MNMNVTYWLNCEDKEQCFRILRKGTAFEKEPAYITAYEVCKGLNEYYSSDKRYIPLRDAQTGKFFHDLPLTATVDKMIKWLREKHDIFYYPAMNLCIPLEDPLSRSVKKFWEEEDAQQKQIEEYCKNDVACSLSLKKMHNQYMTHHVPPITYIDTDTLSNVSAEAFIEDLWRLISDEPVPEIKTAGDQIDFYNKVRRTIVKYKNELLNLRKDHDDLNAEYLELKKDYDSLASDYTHLFASHEKKKRMLNSYYGATCGVTADVYGEIQRLKKERDELKERLESLEGGGYACSGCKRTTCGYFTEILSSLGIKEAVVCPPRGRSRVETLAKLANERAQVMFKEHNDMAKTIDTLNMRIQNQELIIKTQNKSLTEQSEQIKDLGMALSNVKDVVNEELDDLMKTHGDIYLD